MEDINNLIEEAIVKYDNFGDKKPTKQSSVKLCKIFENHSIILKKFDNGEWVDLSIATKKNYLNVVINIIPKIKSIEPDFSKSQKWVNKKVNELKVILDSYINMINTLNKCKKAKKQEDNDLEKLKEIVEDPVDEPLEPIIEEPVVELTSMDEINELIKLWTKQTELCCKRYANETDLHSWEFELETAKQELQFIQKKIDMLNFKIINANKTDDYYTDQLKNVRKQVEKLK